MNAVRIALVGEYDPAKLAHRGIEASMALAREETGTRFEHSWVGTADLTPATPNGVLKSFDAIWCAPGSPYQRPQGALNAIEHARVMPKAFLGTCGGFQHALMEYAQNVLHHQAAHEEEVPDAPTPLIARLSCSLLGAKGRVIATRAELFAKTLGGADSIEEFNCGYGVNPKLVSLFAGTNMIFVAHDEQGQERAFRLAGHPFFIGTLFQPERRALAGLLHPVVKAFLQAAAA